MKRFFMGQLFCLTILLVAVFASVAAAENRAGSFTVSPMVGAHLFDEGEGFDNSEFFGLNLGYNFTKNWSVDLVGTYANVDYSAPANGDLNYWTGRVDALYHFLPEEKFVPYIGVGFGLVSLSSDSSSNSNEDLIGNYGGGFKYFTSDRIALRFDVRHSWRHEMTYDPTSHGKNYGNFVLSGGLTFLIGQEESVSRAAVQGDSDHDGVFDAVDSCFGTPPGAAVDANGCAVDSDVDGVLNADDHCPGTRFGAQVDPEGCEVVAVVVVVADADQDGIADLYDKCPNTPTIVPVNERGCPADTDQDGVFDVDDSCPETAPGVFVDPVGCEIVPLPVEELTLTVVFASNSSALDAKFATEIQKAADFINAHPGQRVVIEGYTDSVGPASFNLNLSQKRADAVRSALVRDYGIDNERLTAKGFGEESPIAENDTMEGRKANRRVVIRAVD